MLMSTITHEGILFDTDTLPEECKVFLDCLDLVSTGTVTLDEHLSTLRANHKMIEEMYQKESSRDDINTSFIDSLLDSKLRIDRTITFLKNHFKNA